MEVTIMNRNDENKKALMNLLAFPALIGGISDYTSILEDSDNINDEGDGYNGEDGHIKKTQSREVNI